MRGVYEQEKHAERPVMLYSPMIVEDGRRVFISNLDVTPLLEREYRAALGIRKTTHGLAAGRAICSGATISSDFAAACTSMNCLAHGVGLMKAE